MPAGEIRYNRNIQVTANIKHDLISIFVKRDVLVLEPIELSNDQTLDLFKHSRGAHMYQHSFESIKIFIQILDEQDNAISVHST